METRSSILPGESPWTEEPGRLQSRGHRESDTTEQLSIAQPCIQVTNTCMTPCGPMGW